MGIFGDLFKSTKEIEREKRRAKRKRERVATRGLENIGRRVKDLEKRRTELWAKASQLVKAGQKAEAAKLLQQYKVLGVQLNKLERTQMLWQNKLDGIATVGDLGELSAAVAGMADGLNVDPDQISDDLDTVEDVESEVQEVDRIMNEAYERDMEKTAEAAAAQDEVSVDDDLMAALESEAAADIMGGKVADDAGGETENINAGRDRLRALLNEK